MLMDSEGILFGYLLWGRNDWIHIFEQKVVWYRMWYRVWYLLRHVILSMMWKVDLVWAGYFIKIILFGKYFTLVIKCSAIFFVENFLCKVIKFKFHSPNFCVAEYLASFITNWIFMICNSDRFLIFVNLISALNVYLVYDILYIICCICLKMFIFRL